MELVYREWRMAKRTEMVIERIVTCELTLMMNEFMFTMSSTAIS